MRFTISQPPFARIIQEAARVADSKRSPILGSLLIRADESGRVFITGYNSAVSITTTATANVEEAGSALVPASELSNLISKIGNDGALLVEGINEYSEDETPKWARSNCTVKWGKKNHATLNGLDPVDFPVVAGLDDTESQITMSALAFSDVVGRVSVCAATDESRPMLLGVQFARRGNDLVLAASDGFFGAIETIPDAPEFPTSVIPASLLIEVAKLARSRVKNQEDESIRIGFTPNGNQVVFRCGSAEVSGSLLDGNYPPVGQLIRPADKDSGSIVLDSQELRQSIARVLVMMSEAVTARLSPSESGLTLTSESATGKSSEEVSGELFGDLPSIGVNPRLIDKILATLPGGKVEIGLLTPDKPLSLRHPLAPFWRATIMPMHISTPTPKYAEVK